MCVSNDTDGRGYHRSSRSSVAVGLDGSTVNEGSNNSSCSDVPNKSGLGLIAYAASTVDTDTNRGISVPSDMCKDSQHGLLEGTGGGLSQMTFSQLDFGMTQSSLDTCEGNDTVINGSCIHKSSYTKEEMCNAMKSFDNKDSSTHLFLKTCQGTLHEWEYSSRRFLYLDIIVPMLNKLKEEGGKLAVSNAYDNIVSTYRSVTGTQHEPPFYKFDKLQNIYCYMDEFEVRKYIESVFCKMDRVSKTISKYQSICNSKMRSIPSIRSKVSSVASMYCYK